MARVEKTIFISYRRKDISWALAVYQYLTSQKYDVFFDFSSLSSGDFEQVIVSNIKARAHFVLILTPTALDRCSEPGDWLRREVETAIDEKRNIIPLFFDGFGFGSPSVAEKLTGKLGNIKRYNGLDIPSGYFMEAMERLRGKYLNVPLSAVIQPVSTEVRKVVKEEQVAANNALVQQKEDLEDLVKPAEEKSTESPPARVERRTKPEDEAGRGAGARKLRTYVIGAGILLIALLGIFGINLWIQNISNSETPTPAPTRSIPTSTATIPPFTPTSEFHIGSTMNSPKDGMLLVYVPAGEFIMGSENGGVDEKPVHTVYLDAYWIDQTEVTNAMFANCVQDGDCKEPSQTTYYADLDYASHPVVYVSWEDANTYCSWADRRLPTEAEWEKAASWDEENQTNNIYPWGDSLDCSFGNYFDGSEFCVGTTTVVGSYPSGVSPYGTLDMAGNAWEWVADWYDVYTGGDPDASSDFGQEYRVLRGGSWSSGYDFYVRSTSRGKSVPNSSSVYAGFRCARSP